MDASAYLAQHTGCITGHRMAALGANANSPGPLPSRPNATCVPVAGSRKTTLSRYGSVNTTSPDGSAIARSIRSTHPFGDAFR